MRPRITDAHRELAQALLDTFLPRTDVFAERFDDLEQVQRANEWAKAKGIRKTFALGEWKPAGRQGARKPLTLDAVARHCAGLSTVGVYPLHPGNVANSVGVDFDNHRGARTIARDPRDDLDALMAVCQRRGVRFLANVSRGGSGYWLHVLPPVGTQAKAARGLMAALLREAGVKSVADGGSYDSLFPKQNELFVRDGDPTAAPGNLFCLPCNGRWMAADAPGTHLLNSAPTIEAQLKHLREY